MSTDASGSGSPPPRGQHAHLRDGLRRLAGDPAVKLDEHLRRRLDREHVGRPRRVADGVEPAARPDVGDDPAVHRRDSVHERLDPPVRVGDAVLQLVRQRVMSASVVVDEELGWQRSDRGRDIGHGA